MASGLPGARELEGRRGGQTGTRGGDAGCRRTTPGGAGRSRGHPGGFGGETSEGETPGASRHETGPHGFGRSKASRG
jgi:hypothetical protein